MAQPPYLTDDEIAEICKPLTNGAARYRYLTQELGLHVGRKPNRQPLVARSEFERVMGAGRLVSIGVDTAAVGDMAALRQRWGKRNGTQAQRR